jgi:hypothetical protein
LKETANGKKYPDEITKEIAVAYYVTRNVGHERDLRCKPKSSGANTV